MIRVGHAPCWETEIQDLVRSGEAAGLRNRAGITATTMAAALGISRPLLSFVEKGQRRASLSLGPRYLRVLRGLAWHEQAGRYELEEEGADSGSLHDQR